VFMIWNVSKACSAFLTATFAAQRVFVIACPLKAFVLTNRRNNMILIAVLLWAFAVCICLGVPWAYCSDDATCSWWNVASALHIGFTILTITVPLPVIAVCVITLPVLLVRLRRSRLQILGEKTTGYSSEEVRNSLAVMIVSMVYVIVVSMENVSGIIKYVTNLYDYAEGGYYFKVKVLAATYMNLFTAVQVVAYAINPCVYFVVISAFRKRVVEVLKCTCRLC
jgi:hypothetical protein